MLPLLKQSLNEPKNEELLLAYAASLENGRHLWNTVQNKSFHNLLLADAQSLNTDSENMPARSSGPVLAISHLAGTIKKSSPLHFYQALDAFSERKSLSDT